MMMIIIIIIIVGNGLTPSIDQVRPLHYYHYYHYYGYGGRWTDLLGPIGRGPTRRCVPCIIIIIILEAID